MGDVITEVAKYEKGWTGGLPETPCGFGSRLSETKDQRIWIPEIVRKYDIRTVADIGAGDLNWIKHMQWDVEYEAYDLVPRHPSVRQFDLVTEIPPAVNMIMCLWVLNHMPKSHCRAAIEHIMESGSTWLMTTDRPSWHHEQPDELVKLLQDYEDMLMLRPDKGDCIKLIRL